MSKHVVSVVRQNMLQHVEFFPAKTCLKMTRFPRQNVSKHVEFFPAKTCRNTTIFRNCQTRTTRTTTTTKKSFLRSFTHYMLAIKKEGNFCSKYDDAVLKASKSYVSLCTKFFPFFLIFNFFYCLLKMFF